ncbi:hypothetical protein AB0C74_31370 [Spirillospora sp. NPDC048832]
MLCRSAIKPVFIGLGAAAVLAAGGASAIAATDAPAPSPSDSGTTAPAVGDLEVRVTPVEAKVDAKDTFDITTTVTAVGGDVADVKVTDISTTLKGTTFTGACGAPFTAAECGFETVTAEEPGIVKSTVTIPDEGPDKTTDYKVTVTVDGAGIEPVTGFMTIRYVVPESPPPTTTPPPTSKPPTKPTQKPTQKPTSRTPSKPSPTPTKSAAASGSGGGGSSSSGSGSSSSGSGGGYVPPSPNSSFDPRNPQVALPPIQAPNPSVAPSPVPGSGTPQSRLQGNKAPVAQDVTFERMASTQIAWLAALLVAFSLLLTQLRLGRRRVPAGAAAKRPKGTHRRPRRGMFGK